MDCSHQPHSIHGIFQARILEWVAFPTPGDLPDPGIELESPVLAGRFFTAEPQGKPQIKIKTFYLQLWYYGNYINFAFYEFWGVFTF